MNNQDKPHPSTVRVCRDPETGARVRVVGGPAGGAMTAGRFDFRPRTPAEIGEQLLRDAQSLELTGASFEKDEGFYRNVAANVRDAAAFLAQWNETVQSMHRAAEGRERVARFDGFIKSQEVAVRIAEIVNRSEGAAATTWRTAAMAINEAIQAVRDSLPVDEEPAT